MFTTSATFTCDTAPADALAAAPPSGAACRSWRTTPSPPAASTVRRIAPTLCGSSTPSSTTMSGAPAAASHQIVDARAIPVPGRAPRRPDAHRPRRAIEIAGRRRASPSRPPSAPRRRCRPRRASTRCDTRIASTRPARKRLEHWVDAVDDHCRRLGMAAGASALQALPRMQPLAHDIRRFSESPRPAAARLRHQSPEPQDPARDLQRVRSARYESDERAPCAL